MPILFHFHVLHVPFVGKPWSSSQKHTTRFFLPPSPRFLVSNVIGTVPRSDLLTWRKAGNSPNFQSHRIHGAGIFTYIYHKNQPNVGKYTIHGSCGNRKYIFKLVDFPASYVSLLESSRLKFKGSPIFQKHLDVLDVLMICENSN